MASKGAQGLLGASEPSGATLLPDAFESAGEACSASQRDKQKLRTMARTQRQGLGHALRARYSAAIVAHLGAWLLPQRHMRRIALYAAIGCEVDLMALVLWCTEHGRSAFAPRMLQSEAPLGFVRIDAQTTWVRGKGALLEPVGDTINADGLDLVLAPGLLFDSEGNRLGYGGGHYDRTLCRTDAARVGVCFAVQRTTHVPHTPQDVVMQAIVDETGVHQALQPGL